MRITARELFALGLWDKFCEETGTNEWAVNEGLLDDEEELTWKLKSLKDSPDGKESL